MPHGVIVFTVLFSDSYKSRFRQAVKDLHECVDFFVSIVECEGRAYCALESKMALGWKRTMVPGSYRDSMIVQMSSNILDRYSWDYK
jgi:uncharacterized protein (DUF2236 family)